MGFIRKLFLFNFTSAFVVCLVAVGITLLPDHLFGDIKFDPQPRSAIIAEVPTNVKVVQVAEEQLIKLSTDKEVLQPESLKFHKNLIYAGTVNGKILRIDESTGKTTVLTSLVDKEAANCRIYSNFY